MRTIDLNADLGELVDGSLDAAVMPFISSANIACGAHAGTPESIRRTLRLALKHGVSVGAHPGYSDPENFGRISMELSADALCALILEQILLLKRMAAEEGTEVRHVKLHGALYNDLADDYERSLTICRAIHGVDPELRFMGRSGSVGLRAAEDAGLVAVHETFADRAYAEEGRLVSRSLPGAVIRDEAESLAQVDMMVLRQKVRTIGGELVPMLADSVCVHGDNPSAIRFVSNLRDFFERQRIEVRSAGQLRFSCSPLGETSLLARLPSRISKSIHRRIRALQLALGGCEGIRELVPCYSELKIDFDPVQVSHDELIARIDRIELNEIALPPPRCVEVPVHYNGPDLSVVAKHARMSEAEVVERHAAQTYLVYMLGFSPGFAYLGGLDAALVTPRLETPRISVPAGAVGIAGNQTGIYPVESPGGWNIIGHTSLALFDPAAGKPFLFEPGDTVRFVPVPEEGSDAHD
jgi:UPF0271 protein